MDDAVRSVGRFAANAAAAGRGELAPASAGWQPMDLEPAAARVDELAMASAADPSAEAALDSARGERPTVAAGREDSRNLLLPPVRFVGVCASALARTATS